MSIKVKTYKGTVQLSGFVNNAADIKQAERIARAVPNVRGVANNLIVKG